MKVFRRNPNPFPTECWLNRTVSLRIRRAILYRMKTFHGQRRAGNRRAIEDSRELSQTYLGNLDVFIIHRVLAVETTHNTVFRARHVTMSRSQCSSRREYRSSTNMEPAIVTAFHLQRKLPRELSLRSISAPHNACRWRLRPRPSAVLTVSF